MSIGPTNWAASVTGSQSAQGRGVDAERRTAESTQQLASTDAAKRGAVDGSLQENEASQDRDADGRELTGRNGQPRGGEPQDEESTSDDPPRSRDASGNIGRNLDLSG